MDLTIVILNYNSGEVLAANMKAALLGAPGLETECYAIDNASMDGSFQKAQTRLKEFKNIHWIHHDTNLGFSRGINPSLKKAQGRWIALLNPDTRIQSNALATLVKYGDEHSSIGILGGKLLYPNGEFQWACRRRIPTPKTALARIFGGRRHFNYPEDINQEMEVEAVSGSFMVIHKALLDTIGAFDQEFYMYGEDLDYCLRCRKAGWKVFYLPAASAIHAKGESSREGNYKALYEYYRAMHLFHRKHLAAKRSSSVNALIYSGIWLLAGWNLLIYPFRRDKRIGSRS